MCRDVGSTVLSLHIEWAKSPNETSINRPILPHAVVALNASHPDVDPQEWDPIYATNSLMSSFAGAVDRDSRCRELRDYWIAKGRQVGNTQDLLECYYSSVTVVRIPGVARYMMIDQQVAKLNDSISQRCAEAFKTKRRSRMVSDSDSLNFFMQSAYEHFSHDLYTPFNFKDVSFRMEPMSMDFGGNILKLAIAMTKIHSDAQRLFADLSPMIGSCILLDCVRRKLKGTPFRSLTLLSDSSNSRAFRSCRANPGRAVCGTL